MENLEIETWKNIPNYENLYQVSNLGRVKSLNYNSKKIEKLLVLLDNRKGYLYVHLCKNGIVKKFYVHQLVCMSFKNFVPDKLKLVVDHIDNNPKNNNLNNLQIISHRQNINKSKNFKKGYSGITLRNNKYAVFIELNKVNYYLGRYKTIYEAKKEYDNVLLEFETNKKLPKNYVNFYSSVKGVSFNKNKLKWIAYVDINKKRINLGYFSSELEAINAKKEFLKTK